MQRWLRAIEFDDRDRHRKLSTEFLSLKKCARRKRLAGDAGRKSQIVLDPRGCARLATERAAINNQNGEPLRCRIHGNSEACRARANDDHVVRRSRLDIGNDSQPYSRLSIARPAQHCPVRTDQDRQIGRLHAEALDKGFAFSTTCIDQRVRVAVPRKQAPKANRRRRSRFSKDDRANAVPLQQRGAPQDEGPHHQFADVRAADEQSSKVREIERIGRAPVRSRADHGQGGMPGKVTYFSAELTRSAGGKYPLPAQTIPSARNDAPLDDQPHGHVPIADIEKLFVRCKTPLRTARETKSELYLVRSQRRNDLGQSVVQQHTGDSARATPSRTGQIGQPAQWPRSSRLNASARSSGKKSRAPESSTGGLAPGIASASQCAHFTGK